MNPTSVCRCLQLQVEAARHTFTRTSLRPQGLLCNSSEVGSRLCASAAGCSFTSWSAAGVSDVVSALQKLGIWHVFDVHCLIKAALQHFKHQHQCENCIPQMIRGGCDWKVWPRETNREVSPTTTLNSNPNASNSMVRRDDVDVEGATRERSARRTSRYPDRPRPCHEMRCESQSLKLK